MRKDIWANDTLYGLLRRYADLCTRRSYRRLKVTGCKSFNRPDTKTGPAAIHEAAAGVISESAAAIPQGTAVIIAPNHSNTLMDALVVLSSRRAPTVFGARADIFNNPAAAKVLRFLKILPMVRLRDGLRNVARNRDVMPEIMDTLAHGVPFCLFPEGTHRAMHSLQPLRKGVARLAVEAAASMPVVILPAGIEYSDYFHYRGDCNITFGKPIDVNAFLKVNSTLTPAEQYRLLLDRLSSEMKKLILCLPEENYDAAYSEWLKSHSRRLPLRLPAVVLGFPLFVVASLLSLPLWLTAELLIGKLKDKAFGNSVRMLCRMLISPFSFIFWAVAGAVFLPWWGTLILLAAFCFSYDFFYDWLNLASGRPNLKI